MIVIDVVKGLGVNRVDTNFGVVLTMTLGATIALATAHFKHFDLVVTALCKNSSSYLGTINKGCTQFKCIAFAYG